MSMVRKLQLTGKGKSSYVLTMPKQLFDAKGWGKGTKFKILEHSKDALLIVKVGDGKNERYPYKKR